MADVARFEMPMEAGLELGAIVRLDHLDAEGQAAEDIIDELDGRPLIAGLEDFQDADPGAIVDRGELIEPSAGARNPLEKLDVHLEAMARLRFLVTRPPVCVPPVLLIGGQPVHAVLAQNAMNGGAGDREAVKPLQVVSNLPWAEMVVLPQIQDLPHDVLRGRPGRMMRRPSSIGEPEITVLVVALPPFVNVFREIPKCRQVHATLPASLAV